jgi:hypothetical protein
MKRSVLPAIVILCLLALPLSARQWTYRSGGSPVEAELVDVKDGNAILKRPDGSQLTIPLKKLSLGDIRYINEELKAAEAAITDGKKEPAASGKPKEPAADKSARQTPKANPNVAVDKLRYKWKTGQEYVYHVRIIGEQGDRSEHLAGMVTYQVRSVADDEVELSMTKVLTHGKTPDRGDVVIVPSRRPSRPPYSSHYGDVLFLTIRESHEPVTITVDSQGKTLHVDGSSQLPYMLGDLSQLMMEELSTPQDGAWTIDNDGVTVISTTRPYHRYTHIRSQEGVPATEKTVYAIQDQSGNLIRIAKHYELSTASQINGKPQFQASGDGKLVFDTERGVPTSLTFNMQVTVREANKTEEIPIRISYRLASDEEMAKMAKQREEFRKQFEKAREERTRPLTDADVQTALADLTSGDSHRIGEAVRLLSQKKPPRPNAKVAKALEAVMLSGEHEYMRSQAADALKDWSTPANVPGLITALSDESHSIRRAALETIVKYKPPKAIKPIAQQLGDILTQGEAAKALKAYGSAAENAVLPYLESKENMTVVEAVKILHAIGTKKSINALEKVAKSSDFMVNRSAQKAVEAIRLREQLKDTSE